MYAAGDEEGKVVDVLTLDTIFWLVMVRVALVASCKVWREEVLGITWQSAVQKVQC
jgi:hypothetical protein